MFRFRSLISWFNRRRTPLRKRPRPSVFVKPRLEALEERVVPTTVTISPGTLVTSTGHYVYNMNATVGAPTTAVTFTATADDGSTCTLEPFAGENPPIGMNVTIAGNQVTIAFTAPAADAGVTVEASFDAYARSSTGIIADRKYLDIAIAVAPTAIPGPSVT